MSDDGGLRLEGGHRDPEDLDILLISHIRADGDGGGHTGAGAGAFGFRIGSGGFGVVAGEVVPIHQVGEIGGRRQHRQHLRVCICIIVIPGIVHIAGVFIRICQTDGCGEVCRCTALIVLTWVCRNHINVAQGELFIAGVYRLGRSHLRSSADVGVPRFNVKQPIEPVFVVKGPCVDRHQLLSGGGIGRRQIHLLRGGQGLGHGEQGSGPVLAREVAGRGAVFHILNQAAAALHDRLVIPRLLNAQPFVGVLDDQAVKIKQVAAFAGSLGHDGGIGCAKR